MATSSGLTTSRFDIQRQAKAYHGNKLWAYHQPLRHTTSSEGLPRQTMRADKISPSASTLNVKRRPTTANLNLIKPVFTATIPLGVTTYNVKQGIK